MFKLFVTSFQPIMQVVPPLGQIKLQPHSDHIRILWLKCGIAVFFKI